MNKTVLKFGFYGMLMAAILFSLSLTFGWSLPSEYQVALGYISMIVPMYFVFFGIKSYRDNENDGNITFAKAFVLGLLISAFVGVGIALIDAFFTAVVHPDFAVEYAQKMKEQGYEGEPPVYSSAAMALLMFVTVILIGIVVSVISALFLKSAKQVNV